MIERHCRGISVGHPFNSDLILQRGSLLPSHMLRHDLFGGDRDWQADDWTDSDDRVRGGKSQSHLRIEKNTAIFHGRLDIDTLGGAGFASQRTTKDDRSWNLSKYDGILLTLDASKSDNKRYAFILKDAILPKDPQSGREQSTVSWEYEFQIKPDLIKCELHESTKVLIPWKAFTPTYRGREVTPDDPLKTGDVKRMSIMMRSYFGTQKGPFGLCLATISAYQTEDDLEKSLQQVSDSLDRPEERQMQVRSSKTSGTWSRLLCSCCRL